MLDAGGGPLAPAPAQQLVRMACDAMTALAHCIDGRQHHEVQGRVEALAEVLRRLTREVSTVELDAELRSAVAQALQVGDETLQHSIRNWVRGALARPLSEDVRFA